MGSYNAAGAISTLIVDGHLDLGAYNLKADYIEESSTGAGVDVDGVKLKDGKLVTLDAIGGSAIPKEVSDNLRNSHDAEAHHGINDASYHLLKTVTFTYGIKGNLRVKFDRKANGAYVVYGRVYKNGVALGTEDGGNDQAYVNFSEDVDVGTVAPGETLEVWGKAEAAGGEIWIQHFRCYYDSIGGAAVGVNT